jgi:hypothetical protein
LSQKHTIQTFSLELQMQSSKESHAVQLKSVQLVNEKLLPSLDEYFTKHFDTDQVIRIQRLEIDLGSIASADWEKEFVNNCLSGIKLKMNALKKEQQLSADEGTEILNQEQVSIEQLLVFLATGKMHWSNKGIDFNEWQTMILDAIQKSPTEFKNKLCELMKQHAHAVERLIAQFDDDFLTVLVDLFEPSVKEQFARFAVLLRKERLGAMAWSLRSRVLMAVLPMILNLRSQSGNFNWKELIEWLNLEIFKQENPTPITQVKETILSIVERLQNKSVEEEVSQKGLAIVEKLRKENIEERASQNDLAIVEKLRKENIEERASQNDLTIVEKLQTESINEQVSQNDDELNSIEDNEKIRSERGREKKQIEWTEQSSVFINNAGIVLLHPFLQNFFTANNLLQDKNFVDEQAQQLAVHLLQYLATGQLQMPEYEMQLNKVLCGMKDEQHINRFIELTIEEKQEADELLQAVIGYWKALKNSSVAGLQETFLQRNAKLSYVQTDDFWKLQVERKGLDILLDKIPWGFGHLQLPWMEKALVVEW